MQPEVSAIKDELAALREEIRWSRTRPMDTHRVTERAVAAPPSATTISGKDEEMEVVGTPHPPHHTEPHNIGGRDSSTLGQREEALMGALIRQFGEMMAARFAAIEDRLLPEKRLRPPLGRPAKEEAETRAEDLPPLSIFLKRFCLQERSKRLKRRGVCPFEKIRGPRRRGKQREGIRPPPPQRPRL
jgi:hypothetical protein